MLKIIFKKIKKKELPICQKLGRDIKTEWEKAL